MNGLEKPFRKKSDPKNRKKNSKDQSEIAACEPLARKRIFVQTPFFSPHFKFGAKKFYAEKTTRFFAPLLVLA